MNILHISRTMGQGGAEKVVYQLCKDIKEVTHFVASSGGKYVEELEIIGVKHITIPDIDEKNPLLILKTLLVLLKAIRENKIDVVHSHHRMASFYSRILQVFHHELKHVYTAHNVFFGRKKIMRFALNNANIVACGETVKKNLIDEYSIPEERIKVIYNSIEKTQINEVHIEILDKKEKEGTYMIGSIGRISEQKGFDVFVKAIAQSKKHIPNIVGVIIGEGEDKEIIKQLVEKLNIEDSVIFLGYQKDVLSIISRMKYIVLCSRWEGFPLTPIETFSVGKTIIVSDIPNNLEIVKPGINGLAFKRDNVDDLVDNIVLLSNNESLVQDLERNAYMEYTNKYAYEVFISNYVSVYNRLLI